ncbi:hypothetical protein HY212_00745 [Candidatus Pacearchaeota archaeon]|nr:hypothetical protein [Candidatus Pacearchaeota archaeon]
MLTADVAKRTRKITSVKELESLTQGDLINVMRHGYGPSPFFFFEYDKYYSHVSDWKMVFLGRSTDSEVRVISVALSNTSISYRGFLEIGTHTEGMMGPERSGGSLGHLKQYKIYDEFLTSRGF